MFLISLENSRGGKCVGFGRTGSLSEENSFPTQGLLGVPPNPRRPPASVLWMYFSSAVIFVTADNNFSFSGSITMGFSRAALRMNTPLDRPDCSTRRSSFRCSASLNQTWASKGRLRLGAGFFFFAGLAGGISCGTGVGIDRAAAGTVSGTVGAASTGVGSGSAMV